METLISRIVAYIINVMMDSLTNFTDSLFKAVELGITMVRAVYNYELEVPVFTWL